MTISGVTFCGREQAEDMMPVSTVAIISITDPGQPRASLRYGWMDGLRLAFHDFDKDEAERRKWVADVRRAYPNCPFMTKVQAASIVQFVDMADTMGATGILVHCEAGKSRSAAVAKWIAEKYGLPIDSQSLSAHNKYVYRMLKEAERA